MRLAQRTWPALVAIGAGWLAVMPSSILSIALRLDEIDSPAFVYSITLTLGWAALIVGVNFFGRLSDRLLANSAGTRNIMLLCTALMLGFNWALSETYSDLLLPVLWVLLQIPVAAIVSFATTAAAESHGASASTRVSALVGATPLLATLLGSLIVQVVGESTWIFLLPAIVAAVALLPFALQPPQKAAQLASVTNAQHETSRGWRWFLIASFFASWTTSATTSFLVPYAATVLGTPATTLASATSGILAGATMLSIAGSLALALRPRSQRLARRSFTIGAGLMAGGVALIIFLPSLQSLAIGGLLCGLGFGLVNGVELHIVQAFTAERGENGRRIGELTAVTTLPYVAVPAIGSVMLTINERLGLIGNFATAAVVSAVAVAVFAKQVDQRLIR